MIKVVTVEQMRQIEAAADASGLSYAEMMENAGRAVASRVQQIVAGREDVRVTVLVGPGNNGGDGLVAGRILAQEAKAQVRFYLLKERPAEDVNFTAVREAGLFVAFADHDHDGRVLKNMVASADVVIDALFGIGVKLPLRNDVTKILRYVQQALNDEQTPEHPHGFTITPDEPTPSQRTKPYVVAVDCPSGLDCDDGQLDATALTADETVTFIAAKPGLFEFPGAAAVGQLHIATAGVPDDLPQLKDEQHFVVDAQLVREWLPKRPSNANKGTFGKAMVVAGSANYIGAAGLSSMAAYRSGAGLVTIGAASQVVTVLSAQFLEPTWLHLPNDMGALVEGAASVIQEEIASYDALLLGPGWGREKSTRDFLVRLLEKSDEKTKNAKRTIGFGIVSPQEDVQAEGKGKLPPLVIDADGLNLLSEIENWHDLLPPNTVITPHAGEMGRLAKLETGEVLENRWQIAQEKSALWGVVLVLKGANTLVASPDGRIAVLPFKTDALATAGTGDVLAGLITGLLAQGLAPFEAAVVGGYLHGVAGTLAGKKQGNNRSVIAGDVLAAIGEALTVLS